MANPYSVDLRERVLADVEAGIPVAQVARKYSITRPPIYDWLALRQPTGSLEPRPQTCGPTPQLDEYREQIEEAVAAEPSLTLVDLQAQLELPVCRGTLWNALDNWDLSLKNKVCLPLSSCGQMSRSSERVG